MSDFLLPLPARQGLFSIAWIKAIASVAGYSTDVPEVDYDSVDLNISQRCSNTDAPLIPTLAVQVKSTFSKVPYGSTLNYPLKLKNYNNLIVETYCPRILIVLHTPEKLNEWLVEDGKTMALSHCAYWLSLRGFAKTKNKTNVTIPIPVSQKFTVESLTKIMNDLAKGKLL